MNIDLAPFIVFWLVCLLITVYATLACSAACRRWRREAAERGKKTRLPESIALYEHILNSIIYKDIHPLGESSVFKEGDTLYCRYRGKGEFLKHEALIEVCSDPLHLKLTLSYEDKSKVFTTLPAGESVIVHMAVTWLSKETSLFDYLKPPEVVNYLKEKRRLLRKIENGEPYWYSTTDEQ